MKLRIKGNSIRLRIGQSEVKCLREKGIIEEVTEFADVNFIYNLKKSEKHSSLQAEFNGNTISVFIPVITCDEFTGSEIVGVGGEMDTASGNKLYILVEKDFKCLDNTLEDQSDFYPNPLADEHGSAK